jgi:acetylornithine deacetylase/succinyl-diaminopimelate desuccinylase-like protein
MNKALAVTLCFAALCSRQAMAQPASGEAQFRALFRDMVETDTSFVSGDCTALVNKVAARMTAAGFPKENLHIFVPPGKAKDGNLVAVLPGKDPKAKAILMHGHIDVVTALKEDWPRDPYVLVEENGQFYGRGVSDMKAQAAIWADTILRFRQQGYQPHRGVKLALTCGEEGGGFVNGAGWLAQNQRELIDAKFAITEGGGGELDADGNKVAVTVMSAEKSGASFVLEATGPGGHSSRPTDANAIFNLSDALQKLKTLTFEPSFNDANHAYFSGMAKIVGGETGAAMTALLANPKDPDAIAVLRRSPAYRAMLGTTCTPVLLQAGHAVNALPNHARATINCRTLPGAPVAPIKAAITDAVAGTGVAVLGSDVAPPRQPGSALTPAFMAPIVKVAGQLYPGLPVVAMQETFGTDSGRFIAVGIPSYGFSGLFRQPDSGVIHGRNEHIGVQSVMEGREFLYRLIKAYAEERD